VLIDKTSLSRTVDAINAAYFENRAPSRDERQRAARWIVARQGMPGAYGGTFAGFPSERARGILLFTGERIQSASARHILGEETSRALRLMRVTDRRITRSLETADDGLMQCLARAAENGRGGNPGLFCCGKCSVGLWRNLLAGGLDRQQERLQRGVLHLRAARDGGRGWRKFPFWYTVLALAEMECAEARMELAYAAPALERAVRQLKPSSVHGWRRHELAVRALKRL